MRDLQCGNLITVKVSVDLRSPVSRSYRAAKVHGLFDVPKQDEQLVTITADLPIEGRDWSIGAIVGASGSGKTTIARQLWPNAYLTSGDFTWTEQCLLDDFEPDLTPDAIIDALTSVGFSSPPAWLRSYHVLSTGQRMRADVARALTGSRAESADPDAPIVFDEFTSTVDRTVAKAVSTAVGKHIQRNGKKFIAVSCHKDFLPWLQPDWVYDTDYSEFTWGSLQRPGIRLVAREGVRESWRLFRAHHYLNHDLATSSRVLLGYVKVEEEEERLAAFMALLPSPGHRGWWRAHRLVVLPDMQGLGIGNKFQELIAETLWIKERKRFRTVTAHPGLIRYARRNPHIWRMSMAPKMKPAIGKTSGLGKSGKKMQTSAGRLTSTLVYVPTDLRR